MNLIIKLLVSSLAVILTSYILPGVAVASFWDALIVSIVLAILNAFIKPLLILLTIPVTILTLGLFLLVINAVIILIAEYFVAGFVVNGFWWALAFSLILSIIISILESFTNKA